MFTKFFLQNIFEAIKYYDNYHTNKSDISILLEIILDWFYEVLQFNENV